MSDLNDGQILVKFLNTLSVDLNSAQAGNKTRIERLVSLIVADMVIYPEPYADSGSRRSDRHFSQVVERNSALLSAFPSFFAPMAMDWRKYDRLAGKITGFLENVAFEDLLHIPGQVHEAFIAHSQSLHDSRSLQKQQGSYYTPAYVVKYMVRKALNYILGNSCQRKHLKSFRALDPACGGASFLIELWKQLVSAGWSEKEALQAIFGTDIEQEAVDLSIFLLTVAAMAGIEGLSEPADIKNCLKKQIKMGNALAALSQRSLFTGLDNPIEGGIVWAKDFPSVFPASVPEEQQGFNLVIGNPPYIANKLIPRQAKKYYQQNYFSARGQFDLAVPFLEQGFNLLKKNGVLCYITSNKFLAADYGKSLRQELLAKNRVVELIDVSTLKTFKYTAAYPIIIIIRKRKPAKTKNPVHIYRISDWVEINGAKPVKVEQKFFQNQRQCIISTELDKQTLDIIKKLEKISGRIPQASIRCGLAIPGFKRWICKNPPEMQMKKNGEHFRSLIQAGHIKPYRIKGHDWIETRFFDAAKWSNSCLGPKLVIPGIAMALTTAIDYSDSLLGRVYYVKERETEFDLRYLAVLLNSQVLNFYYRVMYWPVHLANGYLRFNSGYLANLPVYPPLGGCCPGKRKLIDAITKIGDQLVHQCFPNPVDEGVLDHAEALVFSLYGFSSRKADTVMQFLGTPADRRKNIIMLMKEGLPDERKKNIRQTNI